MNEHWHEVSLVLMYRVFEIARAGFTNRYTADIVARAGRCSVFVLGMTVEPIGCGAGTGEPAGGGLLDEFDNLVEFGS